MRTLFSIVLALEICSLAYSQTTGDYITVASGKWSSTATWSVYNGSTWGPASVSPDGRHTITVGAADSVDIDVAVTIFGTLKSLGGRFGFSTGTLTVALGGVYEHAANGAAIPTATWNQGSTCLVTGVTTTAPSNANQDFYNFTWNCPNQGASLNVAWMNNTIGGTVRILNSSGSWWFRMTASSVPAPGPNTITILGDVVIDSTAAWLTATGSGSPTDTIIVNVHGNLLSKGTLQLANGSGAQCSWLVRGNVLILGGAFTTNSSTAYPDSLIFTGTARQTFFKTGSITTLSNIRFGVRNGAIVDLDTSNVGTSNGSTFTLEPGGTLITGHAGGLRGNLRNGGTTTLSTGANYVFDGEVAQFDTLMPATVNDLTITNANGVSFWNRAKTVNGVLMLSAGILADTAAVTIGATGSVVRTTGYVAAPLQKQLSAGAAAFEVGTANGYSPVQANVTAGSGMMTVQAVEGSHPSTFDPAKTLARYWTLTADPSITSADLTFAYLASDVRGDESKYGALRFTGTGTTWDAVTSAVSVGNHTVTASGVTAFSDWTCGESPATSVESAEGIPESFFVRQNYPNPFNPTTTIQYGLPKQVYVTVKVYSLLGQEIATLMEGTQVAGVHRVTFDASRLSTGIYLCRVQAGSFVETRRMVLVK